MDDKKIIDSSEEVSQQYIEVEGFTEKEVKETTKVIKRFVNSYSKKEKSMTDNEWLEKQLKEELPEKSDDEIKKISDEIVSSVSEFDANLIDINKACDNGVSTEKWFADKISDAAVGVSVNDFGNYLKGIDNAISNANAQMMRTVTTNQGQISQCINLDGFMAEQHAVNTFNMEAQLNGSNFRAEVMVPEPGQTYGLNSFDVVIKDTTSGKIVHQYQFKYGKDAEATIKLLKNGNYNNQQIFVPPEQVEAVQKAFPGKTVRAYIGGTDKVSIKSKIFTKEEAKNMQKSVQEQGVVPSYDWNVYSTKELALNIGKKAGLAGIQGAALTTGFDLVTKVVKGEQIDSDETIELALKTGADSTVKIATAGALEVCTEKGIVTIIPKGTPASVIANIACVGIEDAKILAKVANGELSMSEALDRMGRTTTSMIYGLRWAAKGAAALSWIPVVGPIVGGVVGGMLGYMAGSKFGNAVYSGAKKVANVAKSTAKKVWNGVKSVGSKISSGIKSIGRKLFG